MVFSCRILIPQTSLWTSFSTYLLKTASAALFWYILLACMFVKPVSFTQNECNKSLGTNANWVMISMNEESIKYYAIVSQLEIIKHVVKFSVSFVKAFLIIFFVERIVKKSFHNLVEDNIISWLDSFIYNGKLFETFNVVVQTLS